MFGLGYLIQGRGKANPAIPPPGNAPLLSHMLDCAVVCSCLKPSDAMVCEDTEKGGGGGASVCLLKI